MPDEALGGEINNARPDLNRGPSLDVKHVRQLRQLLNQGQIQLDFSLPHALVEARKDGLTGEDLAETVMTGEAIDDYGERVLLLNFTEDRKIPMHIVLEFFENDSVATMKHGNSCRGR